MAVDVSKKRIIFIHGLASKPPKEDLHQMCKKCLIENVRVNDAELAVALDQNPQVFVSAYWANATPYHIEDDQDYVKKLWERVDFVVKTRQELKEGFHVGFGEKVMNFFQDKGLDLVDIVSGVLQFKDDVMKSYLGEVKLYDEDQYIADQMRNPLESALRDAWKGDCDIALLSHSMGTFISYDVLWRFSHRDVDSFKEYNGKRVQMFVTMGSPLGDSTVASFLFAKHHTNHGIRQYPTNVDFWHNYACLGDIVAHQQNFKDIYFDGMRKLGVFPDQPEYRAIDYASLYNPFEVVAHEGNQDSAKKNPHELYGYLVQPRLGTWIGDFLKSELK